MCVCVRVCVCVCVCVCACVCVYTYIHIYIERTLEQHHYGANDALKGKEDRIHSVASSNTVSHHHTQCHIIKHSVTPGE